MRYELGWMQKAEASGYGVMRRGVQQGMDALGVPHTYAQLHGHMGHLYDTGMALYGGKHKWKQWVARHRPMPTELALDLGPVLPSRADVVRLCVDGPSRWEWDGAGIRMGWTMWESNQLPRRGVNAWPEYLRSADACLVPCDHNRQLFIRDAGLDPAHVHTVHLAVNGDSWPVQDRTQQLQRIADGSRPFVFLMVGELSYRKGFDILLQAFGMAFGTDPRVQLVLKTRGMSLLMDRHPTKVGAPYCWTVDREAAPNVRVLRGDWSRSSLLRLYQMADCFVWPSRGEGYGLPPREAAATGLPVISPAHTGLYDADQWARVVPHSEGTSPAMFRVWGRCGELDTPDVDAVAEAMLWVYNNPEEAQALGARAAAYVRRRTWKDVAQDVVNVCATYNEGG